MSEVLRQFFLDRVVIASQSASVIATQSASAATIAKLLSRVARTMGVFASKEPPCAHVGGFHDLVSKDIDGAEVRFSAFRGQVVCVTNLASR